MVKTPRTRHSKAKRSPVTIELDPGAVSRVPDQPDAGSGGIDHEPEDMRETTTDEPATDMPSADPADGSMEVSPSETSTDETRSQETEGSDSGARSDYDFRDSTHEASGTGKEDEPAKPTAPVAEKPVSRSRMPVFAAGIIGGIVALAGAGLLQFVGVLGTPAESNGPAPALGQVETDISGLKAELAALQQSAGGGDSAAVEDVSKALDQVRSDVASLQKSIASGGAGDSAVLGALGARIDEVETRIAGLANERGGVAPAEIAAINDKITAVEAVSKAAGEANSTVGSKLGAIEQRLDSLAAQVEAQAGQPKIALAIASAALKSAVERGAPFQSEIETFAAISPKSTQVAELRKYAEAGVAARPEILAETDAAANAMIAASAPPNGNAGFFDRLLTSAESLVTVRPIGAVEGGGVPETVARMEVAIQAGDLKQALVEYDTLPEPARAAGAAFADKVRARLEVEQLVDQSIASAMQAE